MSTQFVKMCLARRKLGKTVCVGLDPKLAQIPSCVPGVTDTERVYNFMRAIIDATHQYAICFKPQIACYEIFGAEGLKVLERLIAHIREIDASIPIILDFKRGDIGATNEGYVESAFGFYGADAATIHPYLGLEAMRPFVYYAEKTLFILCRTSNKGAGEFQDLRCTPIKDQTTGKLYSTLEEARREGATAADEDFVDVAEQMPLYEFVAWRVVQSWNAVNNNCALVVGATYPGELQYIRAIVEDMPILIPGVGTQGGDLSRAVEYGSMNGALGVINNSSAISGAYNLLKHEGELLYTPEQWAEAAGEAARRMNESILALAA